MFMTYVYRTVARKSSVLRLILKTEFKYTNFFLKAPWLLGLCVRHFSILTTWHLGRTRLAAKPVARSAWGVQVFM